MNYTYEEKINFQRKEQWIAFESVLRTLCEFYKGEKLAIVDISERAKVIVDRMNKQWPMGEIKDEPFPTINRAPVKGGIPNHCPECGADVKHKTGISKAGKKYDFYGCASFPECKWTLK
jgi:ssDNA-binding Zn-finger/Zn-ribbon topoisomerase 1